MYGLWLFPLLVVMVAIVCALDKARFDQLVLSAVGRGAALMSAAGVCWWLDRSHQFCGPELFPWGHATWHVLTAAAIVQFHRGLFSRLTTQSAQAVAS